MAIYLNNFILLLTGILVSILTFMGASELLPMYGGTTNVWLVSLLHAQLLLSAGLLYIYIMKSVFTKRLMLIINTVLLGYCAINRIDFGLSINNLHDFSKLYSAVFISLFSQSALVYIILGAIPASFYFLCNRGQGLELSNIRMKYIASVLLGGVIYIGFFGQNYSFHEQNQIFQYICIVLFLLYGISAFWLLRSNYTNEPLFYNDAKLGNFEKVQLCSAFFFTNFYFFTITEFIARDTVSLPIIWFIPLVLYLASIVITVRQNVFITGVQLFLIAMAIVLIKLNSIWTLCLHGAAFFLTALLIHSSQKSKQKKNAKEYNKYFCIGSILGGAGVIFINMKSPYLDATYAAILCISVIFTANTKLSVMRRGFVLICVISIVCVTNIYYMPTLAIKKESVRDQFGLARIFDSPFMKKRILMHGSTMRGGQSLVELKSENIDFYYEPLSDLFRVVRQNKPYLSVLSMGLGVGSLSCLSVDGDHFTFIEPNINIKRLVDANFNYLNSCQDKAKVIIGDPRWVLTSMPKLNKYDIIVIDNYISGSIPSHLLTFEAIKEYQSALQPNGILAFHVSNRYIDYAKILSPALVAQGFSAIRVDKYFEYTSVTETIENINKAKNGESGYNWVIAVQGSMVNSVLDDGGLAGKEIINANQKIFKDEQASLF